MTGGLASQHQSRVTVLLVDDQPVEQDPSVARMDFLSTCAPGQQFARIEQWCPPKAKPPESFLPAVSVICAQCSTEQGHCAACSSIHAIVMHGHGVSDAQHRIAMWLPWA